tara:strand:- start:67 stop:294 length:228 start_codon:yes stop_codon:yes gene_type:complete
MNGFTRITADEERELRNGFLPLTLPDHIKNDLNYTRSYILHEQDGKLFIEPIEEGELSGIELDELSRNKDWVRLR